MTIRWRNRREITSCRTIRRRLPVPQTLLAFCANILWLSIQLIQNQFIRCPNIAIQDIQDIQESDETHKQIKTF